MGSILCARPLADEGPRLRFELVRLADSHIVAAFGVNDDQLQFGAFASIRLAPNARVAVARQDDWVLGWARPGEEPTLRWRWDGNGEIVDIGILPDNSTAMALMAEGTLVTLDLVEGKELERRRLDLPPLDPGTPMQRPLRTDWSLQNAAIAQNGALVLRGDGGGIALWRTADGKRLPDVSLAGAPQVTPHLRQLHGGHLLATSARDRSAPISLLKLSLASDPTSRPGGPTP